MMPFSTLQIDDRRVWGGGQSQVLHLLKGLRSASHRAELVTRPGSVLGERARATGVKVHEVPMRADADIFSAWRISRIIRSGRFDIVHMHAAHAHTMGIMSCALNSIPKCVVSRRVVFPIKIGPLGIAKIKYRFRVNAYVAVCEAAKKTLIEVGVNPDIVRVVHSGVAPPAVAEGKDVRREFGIEPQAKVIGTVGELVEAKGHRHLIDAIPGILEQHPTAKLVIVGDGELKTELRDQAVRRGVLESVLFAGFRRDVGDCLRSFDVFVLPSVMEGLNNSIIEAMMMGKPVVATTTGGIPEIVRHEETGLLVPPGNPARLAAAVLELLRDSEKSATLAKAGRRFAMENLTVQKMVDGTTAVYESLMK